METQDEVLDEAGWRTQHFVAEHIAPATTTVVPKWPLAQFNSWQWGTGINEVLMKTELAKAIDIGLEAFVRATPPSSPLRAPTCAH
jgi:hypothetical protein